MTDAKISENTIIIQLLILCMPPFADIMLILSSYYSLIVNVRIIHHSLVCQTMRSIMLGFTEKMSLKLTT